MRDATLSTCLHTPVASDNGKSNRREQNSELLVLGVTYYAS